MGLDNFASRSKEEGLLSGEDLQAFIDADLDLWGGLYSGGAGSFRGEMYDLLLLDATKVSPLQTWIPPETVRLMYEALFSCNTAALLGSYQEIYADLDQDYRGDSLEEITVKVLELRKFFRVCASEDLDL